MKKYMMAAVSLLLLPLTFISAATRSKQELVKAGSWIYDGLAAISIESGKINLADQAPVSIAEILLYLEETDYENLSDSGKKEYDEIMKWCSEGSISFDRDLISLGIEPTLNLEGYYKVNDDIEWTYDRYCRQALLDCPTTFQISDYLTMDVDLVLRQNKWTMSKDDTYLNIPTWFNQFDINFPDTGYISTGYAFNEHTGMNFVLGMGAQDVGRSLTGSIIWSRYFTGSSYANLEFYSPDIRYNMNVCEFNVDKYMYTHRIDVRFFDKIEFGAMEAMLVNAPLELRYLNPWTIYHGTAGWRDYDNHEDSNNCAYFCAKLSYNPCKYLRIYGLYAQDQYQSYWELTSWPDDVTPNGLGGQLGIESFIPFNGGYFHTWLEGYYADPYLYIKQNVNWSLCRRYRESIGDTESFWNEWIGNPFGPDTIAAQLNFGYESPSTWSLTGTYLFMVRGQYAGTSAFSMINSGYYGDGSWVYPEPGEKYKQAYTTPSGENPEYVNRIALKACWSPVDYITIETQDAFVFKYNNNHNKDEFVCGPEFTLVAKLALTRLIKQGF